MYGMNFFEKLAGFLLKPLETFENSRNDGFYDALKYCLIICIISGALMNLLLLIGFPGLSLIPEIFDGLVFDNIFIFLVLIIMILWILMWGVFQYLFVKLLGYKIDSGQSLKILMFAHTPVLLVWWMPILDIYLFTDSMRKVGDIFFFDITFVVPMLVWIAGWIWSIVLDSMALYKFHQLSRTGTIIAILPVIAGFILIFAAVMAIYLFSFMLFSTPK